MQTVEVWCTGKSSHGRLQLGVIERRGESFIPRRLKESPAKWPSGARLLHEDGVDPMPAKSSRQAMVVRDDFEGRERWLFTCPKCVTPGRTGRPMSGANFEQLAAGLAAVGQPGFDVSLLPR